jgi:hypothetical protein
MQLFDVRTINTNNADRTRGAVARQGPCEIDLAALASIADGVMPHVRTRLQRHILRTVRDQAKRGHWLWELVSIYNLRTSVALMALAGHLKPDQAVLGSRDALLVNNRDAFKEITPLTIKTLRGSYLRVRQHRRVQVRPVGQGGVDHGRVDEHALAAEHNVLTDSRFYLSYPTKGAVQRNAQLGDMRVRKGWFENLRPLIALAYLKEHGSRVVAMSDVVCQQLKAWRPTQSELDNKMDLVD